jgi:hypothetical protein
VASTAIAAVLAGPPRPARVLGASSTAVYLVVQGVDAAPEVVAIVAERAVHLPLGVAVPGQAPPVRDPGAVLVGGGAIALGRWSLVPARWVDPRPHLPGRPLGPRLEEVEDLLAVPAETAGVAAHPAIVVADGLRAGDPGPALALLGQGPGLTPAGDDVVAGAAAALAVLERLDAAAADAVVAAARVPQAAELLRALCGHASPAAALDRLLGVGHTTGAALALGLCAGVRSALGG